MSKDFSDNINTEIPQPDDPAALLKRKKDNIKKGNGGWKGLLIEIIVVAAVIAVIFLFVIGLSKVVGSSMEPNYYEGDRVLYLRLANNFQAGDVVIFRTSGDKDYIKRVIAVEGNKVDIDNDTGDVIVNGKPYQNDLVDEPTMKYEGSAYGTPTRFPLTVKEGHVFVLGDNRMVSIDSRVAGIGQIDTGDIEGKVFFLMRGIK